LKSHEDHAIGDREPGYDRGIGLEHAGKHGFESDRPLATIIVSQGDHELAIPRGAVIVRPPHVIADDGLDKPDAGFEIVFLPGEKDEIFGKPLAALGSQIPQSVIVKGINGADEVVNGQGEGTKVLQEAIEVDPFSQDLVGQTVDARATASAFDFQRFENICIQSERFRLSGGLVQFIGGII
jgi:hypothetical protein